MNNLPDPDLSQSDQTEAHGWRDLSETVMGLLLEGVIDKHAVDPTHFASPYDKGAKVFCKDGMVKEDVVRVLPQDVMTTLHNKVANMNGSRAMYDWVTMLNKAYEAYVLGDLLERQAYQLKKNAPVDLASLHQRTADYLTRGITGIRPASEIDYQNYKPFMPSGDDVIDTIIGGIPTDGPIIVAGDTGVGKSHFAAKLMADFLNYHKTKTGAIYTFEMGEEHYLNREISMFPKLGKVKDRLYVSGSIDKPGDLVPEVSAHQFDFLVVDDMENMIDGEASPGKYEAAYKIIKRIARLKRIPVIALSQAGGRGIKATKFLNKYSTAWSSGGENSAAMLIMLQNAGRLDKGWQNDDTFPIEDDPMQYVIFWKSRDDWPKQRGPGAIIREMKMDSTGQFEHKIWSGPLWNGEMKLHRPKRAG